MVQFEELPDGWRELGYDTGPKRGDDPYTEEFEATWASEDEQIVVHVHHSVNSTGDVTYPVTVEQHIEKDGLEAVIQSHARLGDDRREAEELVVEFMSEVNEGEHKLHVLGVQVPEQNDFVQFFTISDSELPGELTGDQLVDLLDAVEEEHDIDDLPDDITRELADDQMIQVDVFPRHKSEVEGIDDS